jgi:ankyrin repeat protein
MMKHLILCLSVVTLAAMDRSLAANGNVSDDFYTAIRVNDLPQLRTLVGNSGSSVNSKDVRGETPLMYSAAAGSLDAMKLLIGKGADVNAQSESGLTALILAATDLAKVGLLVDRGANVNLATKLGRTALFVAAMSDRSAEIARLLIAKGSNVRAMDAFKNTMLNAAAAGNDFETIRLMLDAGVDVNAAATTGLTPLMLAAGQSNVRAVKMLLAKGAKVDAVGAPFMAPVPVPKNGPVVLDSYTPLLLSVASGPPDLVKALVDAGADVNARDSRNLTPLMLAVATDHQDPAIIRLLLPHADLKLKSKVGETAMDWATKVGAPAGIGLLHAERTSERERERAADTGPMPDLRAAVEHGVALLEKTSQGFFAGSGCVGCHAQSITDFTVAEARAKRVRVDDKAAEERINMVRTASFPAEMLYERMDILIPEIVAYQLTGLAAVAHPPDHLTDAMAANIAASQSGDGSWRAFLGQQRPGAEDGDIFRTALCVRSLKVYGPPGRGVEMAARIAQARQWLLQAKPVTAEDRNMQLLGLYWAGSDTGVLKRLAKAIVAAQQPDGGWRQRDGLPSDAYATGESLYALTKAGGLAPSDPSYQRGAKFLLTTQRPDGSWRVVSRSPKFQTYFTTGFPYAGDQWISSWATGWATMALAQAIEPSSALAAR